MALLYMIFLVGSDIFYLFVFNTMNISSHSLLAYRISTEKCAVNLIDFPLYVTPQFSLTVFSIIFSFWQFNDNMPWRRLLVVESAGVLWASCFSKTWKIFNYSLSNYSFSKFSMTFPFLPLGNTYNRNIWMFNGIP